MPTYSFYVKLMEKTKQVLPEALVTVEASNELSGRMRATKQYALDNGISMWTIGIVTETAAQRAGARTTEPEE
jgi:hypothetical protein